MIFLIKLLLAHVIGDFILQRKSWVEDKQKRAFFSPCLYLHSVIHALLAWLFIMEWENWKLPLLVFIFHMAIDLSKSLARKSFLKNITEGGEKKKALLDVDRIDLALFISDQILHFISIVIVWVLLKDTAGVVIEYLVCVLTTIDNWIIILAYLVILFPVAITIALATNKWQKQLEENDGLKYAGKYIGMTERFLILTFLLLNQYAAIGFLLAAKSVFRFGELKEAKDRKKTEYILIGTLLSFSITIIIGLITLSLLA